MHIHALEKVLSCNSDTDDAFFYLPGSTFSYYCKVNSMISLGPEEYTGFLLLEVSTIWETIFKRSNSKLHV